MTNDCEKRRPPSRALAAIVAMSMLTSCSTPDTLRSMPVVTTAIMPALPVAISNNAVTAVNTAQGEYLVSFNGLAEGRQWNDTLAATLVLPPGANAWDRVSDVPGDQGRLASIAVTVGKYAYVFGGYTVAQDHTEVSLPVVHRFDPVTGAFDARADMPVPVDDAMALVYQERYIYLISGWHDSANVNLVQRYDSREDVWVQATAYPGAPVFGHAGGIVDNQLVVCGGVEIDTYASKPRAFVMNDRCYAGTIREDDARRIDWRTIPSMPDKARYRMASIGSSAHNGVLFVGGSDNPYNYDGIGYNSQPSEPSSMMWLFDLETDQWASLGRQPVPSMDHRGLLDTREGFVTVGGMLGGQRVTNRVVRFRWPQ